MRLVSVILFLVMQPVVWAANPIQLMTLPAISDDTIGYEAPRAMPVDATSIEFVLTPDSYEPASLMLAAKADLKQIEMSVGAFANAEGLEQPGIELDIRYVKRWYQKQFGGFSPKELRNLTSEVLVHDDTLIRVVDGRNELKLSDGRYVDISQPKKYQKPQTPTPAEFPVRDADELLPLDLGAGERRQLWFTLYAQPDTPAGKYQSEVWVQVGEEVLHVIPVRVEVLPFMLDESRLEYSMYYRGKLDKAYPEGSISSEYKSREQMLADLQNMRAHGITNPNVYQKIDTGLLEEVMQIRQEAGFSNEKLYYLGVNVVRNNEGSVSPQLAREVKKSIEIASRYGFKDVYFFARDEARGEELLYQKPFWDTVKRAGGKIMAAGWKDTISKPGNFSVTGGEEDLYICLGYYDPDEARKWHEKGKLIYAYHNPPNSFELPFTMRRNYGLLLWQSGYDGTMPYVWQHSFGTAWNDFDHFRHRNNFAAYPALNGPLDTIQWEGFREGVDDVRYLSTLLNMVESGEYRDSPYFKPAQEWLEAFANRPLNNADLNQVRAEIIGFILALLDWSEVDQTLPEVDSLQVSLLEPDSSATLSWNTSLRTDAIVRVGRTSYELVPRMRSHSILLSDLRPGKNNEVSISLQSDNDQEPQIENLELSVNKALTISGIEGGAGVVSLMPETDYRASVVVDPDQSLLGWWRFSGKGDDLQDASGRQSSGELKGNAKRVDGWFGRGVRLDGKGSFVYMPDIDVEEDGTVTIEGWFRFNSLATDETKNRGLFSSVYQHGDNNNLYFSRTNDSCLAGNSFSRGVWHHVVVSWNGDVSTARCYVDGQRMPISIQKVAEEIRSISGFAVGRSNNYLGGRIGSATNTLDGDIDEIRVWNRVLGDDEVRAAYLSGRERLRLELPDGPSSAVKIIGANAAGEQVVIEN